MRYLIEPRERRYVKGYGFMSFTRNFIHKYGQSLIDASKKFAKLLVKKYLKKQQKQLEI